MTRALDIGGKTIEGRVVSWSGFEGGEGAAILFEGLGELIARDEADWYSLTVVYEC